MEEKTPETTVLIEENSPDQKPSSDPPSQPVTSSKAPLVAAVLLLVLAVVGAAAYYYYRPTNTVVKPVATPVATPAPLTEATPEPAAWQTYTNAKYGYSIDYPNDWTYREFPSTKSGAAFRLTSEPVNPGINEPITIDVSPKVGNYLDMPFADYVKIAGSQEIQNYEGLLTNKPIVTKDGVTGYQTTWKVSPLASSGSGSGVSLPITYFALPSDQTQLVRVSLNSDEALATYEQLLPTFKLSTAKIASPTPVVDEAAVLKTVIAKYIAQKHGSNPADYTIAVTKIDGNFAKGSVSADGGGGIWFAAKEDGVWKLVWDGNGIIECSTFDLYPNFSKTLVPECYDTLKEDLVKR